MAINLNAMTDWDAIKKGLGGATGGKVFDEKAMAAAVKAKIFGQDRAIDQVATQLKRCLGRAQASGGKLQKPLGVFLVAGPACVGKTLFCKALADQLYDGKGQLQRFAMDQFAQPQTRADLFGAPEGFVGGKGRLTSALQQNPRTIFELEGIEKAHADVLQTLMAGWKDSYFTDLRSSERISNTESLFFLTSVAAWEELLQADHANEGNPIRRQDAIADVLIRARFSQEFVARLDDTFIFEPLDNRSLARLAETEIRKTVTTYGLTVTKIEPRYLFNLVSDEESRAGGLRNISRRIEFELGDQFLELRQKGVKSIAISQEDGKPVATDSTTPLPPVPGAS